jgi:hypothetical protein
MKWLCFGLALALFLAGCTREPASVLDLKIADGDWADYNRSLQAISNRQTPEERAEFEQALQEMKFQAMLGDGPTKASAMRGDIRRQLAGKTVRDVLVLHCTIKLGRKQEQETALQRSVRMNARLRTKPGDEASADFLDGVRAEQAKQLESLQAEITTLVARIEALSPNRSRPF